VLEGEHAEPHGGDQRAASAAIQPGEPRIEKRGAAIKGRPPSPQHEPHDQQQHRFLVVEPFQQGRRHSRDDRRGRQVVGGIEAPRQPLREISSADPHAAEK